MGYSGLVLCMVLCSGITWCDAVCQKLLESGLSQTDRDTALNAHNYFRRLAAQGQVPGQPRAKNLKPLQWSDELARQAQELANQCIFAHNSPYGVGQNLFQSGDSNKNLGADWSSTVEGWFSEFKRYKYPNSGNSATGHYTQVVSARSKYVGCGYSQYYKNGFYQKLYVCNYSPAGNFNGQPPYEI